MTAVRAVGPRSRGLTIVVAFALAALAGVTAAPIAVAGGTSARRIAVVVEASSSRAAADAVVAAGGQVTHWLPVVGGVAAAVDGSTLQQLSTQPNLITVTDRVLHPTSASFDAATNDVQLSALDFAAPRSPTAGAGVAVALVDTGVTPTADLHAPRLVAGPDLSGEGDHLDHFGHGTFMAGLIAGDGTASRDDPVQHVGAAPGATLVSVKVAGTDGTTTLSRVLAGIGWVIASAPRLDIRVMNLSFGVAPSDSVSADPLDRAVQVAWRSGIAVVAAAGNGGAAGVDLPGADRAVLTVGASDPSGTATTSDDAVPTWSSRQRFNGYSKPEVVAPGVSVVSLRDPGSAIDVAHPQARIGDTYFRGSGSSMSTALVSGAIATLIQRHPFAFPDDLKNAVVRSAAAITGGNAVDVARADAALDDAALRRGRGAEPSNGNGPGTGRGPASASAYWDATSWRSDAWVATSWRGGSWDATSWRANGFDATSWRGDGWSATSWRSDAWDATSWRADAWSATSWRVQSWGTAP